MNNKLCPEVSEEILGSDGEFSLPVQNHLKSCTDCAALAANWNALRAVEQPTVPAISPTLDFAVLSAATKAQARYKWMLPKWFYAISSAACAIMFSWLVIHSHQYEANRRNAIWDTPSTDQAMFMLDSEIEFNRVFINIVRTAEPADSDQEINDIVDEIPDVSSDSEIFEPLLTTANEAQLL